MGVTSGESEVSESDPLVSDAEPLLPLPLPLPEPEPDGEELEREEVDVVVEERERRDSAKPNDTKLSAAGVNDADAVVAVAMT